MINFTKRQFIRTISIVLCQIFLITGILYPDTSKKIYYEQYISNNKAICANGLRVPMGFRQYSEKGKGFSSRFLRYAKIITLGLTVGTAIEASGGIDIQENSAKPDTFMVADMGIIEDQPLIHVIYGTKDWIFTKWMQEWARKGQGISLDEYSNLRRIIRSYSANTSDPDKPYNLSFAFTARWIKAELETIGNEGSKTEIKNETIKWIDSIIGAISIEGIRKDAGIVFPEKEFSVEVIRMVMLDMCGITSDAAQALPKAVPSENRLPLMIDIEYDIGFSLPSKYSSYKESIEDSKKGILRLYNENQISGDVKEVVVKALDEIDFEAVDNALVELGAPEDIKTGLNTSPVFGFFKVEGVFGGLHKKGALRDTVLVGLNEMEGFTAEDKDSYKAEFIRTLIHEYIHNLCKGNAFEAFGQFLNEGMTEYLTSKVMGKLGFEEMSSAAKPYHRYAVPAAYLLNRLDGKNGLIRAFFNVDKDLMRQVLGEEVFEYILSKNIQPLIFGSAIEEYVSQFVDLLEVIRRNSHINPYEELRKAKESGLFENMDIENIDGKIYVGFFGERPVLGAGKEHEIKSFVYNPNDSRINIVINLAKSYSGFIGDRISIGVFWKDNKKVNYEFRLEKLKGIEGWNNRIGERGEFISSEENIRFVQNRLKHLISEMVKKGHFGSGEHNLMPNEAYIINALTALPATGALNLDKRIRYEM